MCYRRKIILALIEVFGGSLPSTDCEKLLFTFCQQTCKNRYDFFPYKHELLVRNPLPVNTNCYRIYTI